MNATFTWSSFFLHRELSIVQLMFQQQNNLINTHCSDICTSTSTTLLFILKPIDQSSNVRQNLHRKFITLLDRDLWLLGEANTGRRASNNNGSRKKSCTLREKANELRNVENKVTFVSCQLIILGDGWVGRAYSSPQS